MRVTRLFGETHREAPADTDVVSHQLLLRAGYVRQVGAGIFTYLPICWRSIRKIEQILREEMNRIGGQEMNMPVVHPAELWKQTGRWESIDESLARFRDRGDRDMVLAMTHEEVVAEHTASEVHSYRQLPQLVYHIQTKFRDEPRARGGLIRVREFVMKDSYSLDKDEEGLRQQYDAHYEAYGRIGHRVGLPLLAVSSDVGMMGGNQAHEFMYVTPIGEDTLAVCNDCGHAANREVAQFTKPTLSPETIADLEEIETPGTNTIESLADFLHVPVTKTAKAVFFVIPPRSEKPEQLVLAIVRGDHDVNQARLQGLLQTSDLETANDDQIRRRGVVPGYGSAVGITADDVIIVVDDVIAGSANLIGGANREGYHLLNINIGRDFQADIVGDIAAVYEGAPCPDCQSPLSLVRGVEVGNIFQLGTRYTEAFNATYSTESGEQKPVVMGSYGIGVGRLLACIAEEHRTDDGLALPIAVAPYEVALIGLWRTDGTRDIANKLYDQLLGAGIEVLFDDRDASAGVKFADADLRGLPLRVTVSERSVKSGGIEIKRRLGEDARIIELENAVVTIQQELDDIWQDFRAQWPVPPSP